MLPRQKLDGKTPNKQKTFEFKTTRRGGSNESSETLGNLTKRIFNTFANMLTDVTNTTIHDSFGVGLVIGPFDADKNKIGVY